ncbi:MAG TPA: hypothetical protein DDW27_18130 [Bacteroidales bacterium]|nr:hypothetical protein [Bacteroidales bacterium]
MKKNVFSLLIALLSLTVMAQNGSNYDLYDLSTGLKSRSISFENPSGEPGKGGTAASKDLRVSDVHILVLTHTLRAISKLPVYGE